VDPGPERNTSLPCKEKPVGTGKQTGQVNVWHPRWELGVTDFLIFARSRNCSFVNSLNAEFLGTWNQYVKGDSDGKVL